MMKKVSTLLLLIIISTFNALAQSSSGVEMATALRSSGTLFVVVAAIVIVFVGVVAYLISIDRKLSKLEKKK